MSPIVPVRNKAAVLGQDVSLVKFIEKKNPVTKKAESWIQVSDGKGNQYSFNFEASADRINVFVDRPNGTKDILRGNQDNSTFTFVDCGVSHTVDYTADGGRKPTYVQRRVAGWEERRPKGAEHVEYHRRVGTERQPVDEWTPQIDKYGNPAEKTFVQVWDGSCEFSFGSGGKHFILRQEESSDMIFLFSDFGDELSLGNSNRYHLSDTKYQDELMQWTKQHYQIGQKAPQVAGSSDTPKPEAPSDTKAPVSDDAKTPEAVGGGDHGNGDARPPVAQGGESGEPDPSPYRSEVSAGESGSVPKNVEFNAPNMMSTNDIDGNVEVNLGNSTPVPKNVEFNAPNMMSTNDIDGNVEVNLGNSAPVPLNVEFDVQTGKTTEDSTESSESPSLLNKRRQVEADVYTGRIDKGLLSHLGINPRTAREDALDFVLDYNRQSDAGKASSQQYVRVDPSWDPVYVYGPLFAMMGVSMFSTALMPMFMLGSMATPVAYASFTTIGGTVIGSSTFVGGGLLAGGGMLAGLAVALPVVGLAAVAAIAIASIFRGPQVMYAKAG